MLVTEVGRGSGAGAGSGLRGDCSPALKRANQLMGGAEKGASALTYGLQRRFVYVHVHYAKTANKPELVRRMKATAEQPTTS